MIKKYINLFKAPTYLVVSLLIISWLFDDNQTASLPNANSLTPVTLDRLPDFSVYTDVSEKKNAFFETLYPVVEYENQKILAVRDEVLALQRIGTAKLKPKQSKRLLALGKRYKVKSDTLDSKYVNRLLARIDYIPPSLVLTQAAIESGWGSSRFSKEGNNLFGQWCFKKGCGMVPSSRDEDKGHEVARFATVNASVRAYLHNLNTNRPYEALRKKRAEMRQNNQPIKGSPLAKTLSKYSEEGDVYINKLISFIEKNELQRYTKKFQGTL